MFTFSLVVPRSSKSHRRMPAGFVLISWEIDDDRRKRRTLRQKRRRCGQRRGMDFVDPSRPGASTDGKGWQLAARPLTTRETASSGMARTSCGGLPRLRLLRYNVLRAWNGSIEKIP